MTSDVTSVFIIAEVGINHNGDMKTAKKLIDGAVAAGCDAVKFQKRTIDEVYTTKELDVYRESPWGKTNRAQKEGLEFSMEEYAEIDRYCREVDIAWFASAWDLASQKDLQQFDCEYNKVASAMLTDRVLLETIADEGKYTFISTGMSTLEQIASAISIFRDRGCPFEIMHCNSTYPMPDSDANLRVMKTLADQFCCDVGYSGHEAGIIVSCAAAALGATSVERHITLDRAMYGSDQSASLELVGLNKLVKYIRSIELALGSDKKTVQKTEVGIAKKLRRVDSL